MIGLWRSLVVVLCALPAAAQPRLAEQLSDPDPVVAEIARRKLVLRADRGLSEPNLRVLLDLLDSDVAAQARAAASVLRASRAWVAETVLGYLIDAPEGWRRQVALPLKGTAPLRAALTDEDPGVRQVAVATLQERGALGDAELGAALDDVDADVAALARAILVHERVPFAPAVLHDLSARGQQRVVEALAETPRRGARAWLLRLLEADDLTPRLRLRALAALPPEELTPARVRILPERCDDPELQSEVQLLAWRLPAATADRLVGQVHARIAAGVAADAALVCLSRCSPLGERQVLALSEVLPPAAVEQVCSWLAARSSEGLAERVASALDGEVPLAPHLLRRCSAALDRDARVDRVVAALADENAPEQHRVWAFDALVRAEVYRPEMLAFVGPDFEPVADAGRHDLRRQRVRALLRLPLSRVPPDVLRELMADADPGIVTEVYTALQRAPYPPSLRGDLLGVALGDGPLSGAAARTVALFGDRAEVEQVWAAGDHRRRRSVLQALVERPRPWCVGWLAQAARAAEGTEIAAPLLRARVRLGAPEAVRAMLGELGAWSAVDLRRSRSAVTPLLVEGDLAVLATALATSPDDGPEDVPDTADEAVREELVRWLVARAELPGAVSILRRVATDDPSEDVRLAAREGLLRGGGADALHRELRAALSRPLTEDGRELAYEVVGSLSPPLDQRAYQTLAQLLFRVPLASPEDEVRAALEAGPWPRRGDDPLLGAAFDALRRDPAAAAAAPVFAAEAAAAAGHPHRWAATGRRFGHQLALAAGVPHLRGSLGVELAPLVLAAPDLERRFDGAAWLLQAEAAEDAQDWAAAERLYRRAARSLLREPLPPLWQRAVLGEAPVAETTNASAALAARPWLCAARRWLMVRDLEAAARALDAAADLGMADQPTTNEVHELRQELDR